MGIFDKAKTAKDAAAEKTAALKERASSAASELIEQAASRAGAVFEGGFARVSQPIEDLNAALPIVRQAGYTLAGVTVDVSLSPSITASFTVAEALSDEQIERIALEHAENKLAVMIVWTLHRAGKLQSSLRIGGLRPLGLSVGIGLSPSVSIKFG